MTGKHARRVPGRVGTWTQTLTGGKFFPLDPRPEDFVGKQFEIAEQLAKKCRYSGATPGVNYSNAEHCYLVSVWAERLAFDVAGCDSERRRDIAKQGLLHDASDAYMTDLPTPIKYEIDAIRDSWIPLERSVTRAIYLAFGVPIADNPIVKQADREVANAEVAMLAKPDMAGFPLVAVADVKPIGLGWIAARNLWLDRFYDLWPA